MKVALIYTPRCGSTSIFNYFQDSNPEYTCINEPWFDWMVQNVHGKKITYDELLNEENIFIKTAFKTLPVSLDKIINDFDNVVFLLRKNIVEQVESAILLDIESRYLDMSKRKYWIDQITDEDRVNYTNRYHFLNETLMNAAIKHNKALFYYEDLYYGDFTPFFNELNLKYDDFLFKKHLNIVNRYRDEKPIESKKNKTIL